MRYGWEPQFVAILFKMWNRDGQPKLPLGLCPSDCCRLTLITSVKTVTCTLQVSVNHSSTIPLALELFGDRAFPQQAHGPVRLYSDGARCHSKFMEFTTDQFRKLSTVSKPSIRYTRIVSIPIEFVRILACTGEFVLKFRYHLDMPRSVKAETWGRG